MQEQLSANITIKMKDTNTQYKQAVEKCKELYLKKVADYGTSWRVLRPISIVDQVYIKAWRIRQIQETGVQKIAGSIEGEFIGKVNYGIIALIQFTIESTAPIDLNTEEAKRLY